MSQYFGGVQALCGGLVNEEQLRRNAIRKLEAEGKIEKGSLGGESVSIDHGGEAAERKEVAKIEETGKECQGGKDAGGWTTTTVYEAPPTYEAKDEGSTGDGETLMGMEGAVRRLFRK